MEGFYSPFYHRYPLSSFLVDRYHPFDPRLSYYEPLELSSPPPLDLSLKGVKNEPVTPPSTPSPKSPPKKSDLKSPPTTPVTPVTPVDSAKKSAAPGSGAKTPSKRQKAVRKLNFDEDKVSPVSGTIIRSLDETLDDKSVVVRKGDIDPIFNVVEVTEEAKAELAKIENKIGDYICRLCRITYDDAFSLAQHRCSCIVHVEYRCPECDKVFNCPANLASHRRWHKPKEPPATTTTTPAPAQVVHSSEESEDEAKIPCPVCGKLFRRQSYLRKHLVSHTMTAVPMMGLSHLAVAN